MTLEEFKKPFNIVTLLIAVASVLLSFFFYKKSQQRREIAYLVSEPSKIFDSTVGSSKIKVLDALSKTVTNDVYLMTFTFWNSGNLPIEPSDVRHTLNIVFDPCDRVLDATILKQTDPEVSGFSLIEATYRDTSSARGVMIKWEHFDPNRGVKFQVLYAGNPKTVVSWGVTYAGSGEIVDARSFSERHQIISNLLSPAYAALVLLALSIVGFIKDKTKGRKRIASFVAFVVIFSICCYFIYRVFHSGMVSPL